MRGDPITLLGHPAGLANKMFTFAISFPIPIEVGLAGKDRAECQRITSIGASDDGDLSC